MELPKEAVLAEQVTTPGYYWWLPACASSTDAQEWTIVAFHPLNHKRYAGWFVGPLEPPKVPRGKTLMQVFADEAGR